MKRRRSRRRRRITDQHLVRVDVGEVVEHDLEVAESRSEGDLDREGAAAGLHHHQARHHISICQQARGIEKDLWIEVCCISLG